jgi:leader peptidase (prepilin peptidase)/N-methyltransferase
MSESGSQAGPRARRSELALAFCIVVAVGLTFLSVDYPRSVPGAGLAAIALIIARADWRARIIPNPASLAAAALALAEALISEQPQAAAIDALTRGAALFLLFLGFRSTFRFWRGREGMGLGDVKLAGVLGLWLDWSYIPVAIELACVSAIAFGTAVSGLTKLPFGAFFAPAIWATWMCENLSL